MKLNIWFKVFYPNNFQKKDLKTLTFNLEKLHKSKDKI